MWKSRATFDPMIRIGKPVGVLLDLLALSLLVKTQLWHSSISSERQNYTCFLVGIALFRNIDTQMSISPSGRNSFV